jgi:dimethylargininase
MDAVRVFDFDSAMVRTPAPSVVDGLRVGDHDGPSYEGVLAEFAAYVAALESAGVAVETLPALDAFPDSVFVEDPAFVLPEGAIVLRPGTASRIGEAEEIAPTLRRRFEQVLTLGGLCRWRRHIDPARRIESACPAGPTRPGPASVALAQNSAARGIAETPPGVLHFKPPVP